MKIFKIKVDFKAGCLHQSTIELVKQDYNSTEFLFEFDIEGGRNVFELKKPNGNKYIKDIIDNKIALVDYDEELNEISLILQSGTYEFEIVHYDGDSKLTLQEHGYFYVRDEIVEINDSEIEDDTRLPILDDLINQITKATNDANASSDFADEQAEYAKKQGDYAKQQAQTVNQANENAINIINTFESNVNKYTSSFNVNAESKTESYDKNAEAKLEDYNTNYTDKLKIYNDNHNSKVESYNENADKKVKSFDDNVTTKTETFNQNAENKTTAYNQNHDSKLKEYNENSTKKQTDFNTNASNKLTEYNDNAIAKLEEYNTNHNTKSEEYNANAESKVNEFNLTVDHIEDSVDEAYDNQIIGSAEGESIYLKDSANARLRVLNVDGNFKQETTTGKNKLDISYLPISEAESLLNGGSYTFDEKTNKITLDATNASGVMTVKSLYKGNSQLLLKAGTYYSQVRFNAKKVSDGTSMQFVEGIVNLEDDVYIIQWFITCSVGLTKTIYPQIEDGDSLTLFEKYTGGQASPSPNYPQEIEVDEGIENLFDKDNVNKLSGIPDSNSKTFVASSSAKSFYIPCDSNEKYVVSRKIVGSRFTVGTTENIPTAGEPIIDIIVANNSRSITIDTSSNAKFLVVYYLYNSSENETEILSSIQIEKNKTQHNYVPFGRWKKIRIMGKNFCNLGNEVTEKIGVAVEYNYNELKINGTTTSGGNITTIRDNINFDGNRLIGTFPAGTYTFTSKLISGNFARAEGGTFAFYIRNDANETLFSYGGNFDTTKKITLAETTPLYLQFYTNNENIGCIFDNCIIQFQIEPEEIATEIEPYKENELLINLQNNFIGKTNGIVKDQLQLSLNKEEGLYHALLKKKVGKRVFVGDETWKRIDTQAGYRYVVDVNDLALNTGNSVVPNLISNRFKAITNNQTWLSVTGISCSITANQLYLCYETDETSTLDGFKKYLSNNPVTVYYELAEPYEIDLGVVDMPKTYENISNITLISNMDTNMQVEYVKHTKTVIDNLQSQIDAINTLLSTTATSAMLLDNYENDLESEVMS